MDQSEKEKHLASLRKFKLPAGFSSRAAAKTTIKNLRKGMGRLVSEDEKMLADLDGLLATAAFGLAAENEITLGMIKPKANEGIGLPSDDDAAAQAIIAAIGVENVALQFHTLLAENQVARLYGEETMIRLWKTESEKPGKPPVARVLLDSIISDPVTIILVSRMGGGAVEWLKEKVGKTRPSEANPESIRGRHGRDDMLPNNLIHRSDTAKDALAEIKAFRSIVNDFI